MARLFVAIPASVELQKKILRWEADYGNFPVRWLQGKNLHITLIPPWYEKDMQGPIEKLLLLENCVEPFKVTLQNISFGPDPKRPRLIWIKGDAPEAARSLQKKAEEVFGIRSEYRPWKMHLTIARFKENEFLNFPVKKLDKKVSWNTEISSVVLMQSHLSREGADYEILKEVKFNDG